MRLTKHWCICTWSVLYRKKQNSDFLTQWKCTISIAAWSNYFTRHSFRAQQNPSCCFSTIHEEKQIWKTTSVIRQEVNCSSRQRKLGLFSLENRGLWADSTVASPYIKGAYEKDRERLLTWAAVKNKEKHF